MNSQMKRYRRQCLEGSWTLLSLWSWWGGGGNATLLAGSPTWETLWTSVLKRLEPSLQASWFAGAESFHSNHLIFLVTSSILSLCLGRGGPILSHLIRINTDLIKGNSQITKDNPVTEEISRIFGVLCQERGQRPNMFYIIERQLHLLSIRYCSGQFLFTNS